MRVFWRWFLQSSYFELSLVGVGTKPGKKNMKRMIILSLILSLPLNAQDVIFSNSFENRAPVIISSPETKGSIGVAYSYDVEATDADGDLLAYFLTMSPDGMMIDALTGEISWTPAKAGDYPVTVEVSDGPYGFASQSWSIAVLPPNPVDVATENDPTVATTIFHSSDFLYKGDNPVQVGVEEGTIAPARVAVIRGSVMTRDGAPLPGVVITIHNHDEYGLTLSRDDGEFDMAVNGGGALTLNYNALGYLPAQRQLNVPWQDYVFAPDVALVALDPVMTTIDLATATGMQVARGSMQNDTNGDRQATVMFPQGVSAELRMPDGSTQPISSLDVRATEYTVGENGPEAMPGELPPTSGYTYAVELSIDEALSAGATMVNFDQPLPFYVENFLEFPTGVTVPSGYYDRDKAAWVPSDNGRIVEILSVTDNKVDLDIEGAGSVADETALSVLGITDAEREHLAGLYAIGTSLWRVPIPHFTPWDHNWPYGPPADAAEPNQSMATEPGEQVEGSCEVAGSIIECQNQVLGERLPVQGTEFTLNYRSNRQKGFKALNSTHIPLTDNSLPASVLRVELDMSIAGQRVQQTYDPAFGLSRDFEWNGEDAYGRPVSGTQTLSGSVKYVYPYVYYESPQDFENAFGIAGNLPMASFTNRNGGEFSLNQNFSLKLGTPPRGSTPIAGWSLDVHHSFDPVSGTLYLGDGTQRKSGTDKIDSVESNGRCSSWYSNLGIKIGPDGSFYYADKCNDNQFPHRSYPIRIKKQSPDGVITAIVGGGDDELTNGIMATAVKIGTLKHFEVAEDGSVYYLTGSATPGGCQLRRVTPEGLVYTVMNQAGRDNCPSTSVYARHWFSPGNALDLAYAVGSFALAPDGRVIMSAPDMHRILQIDQNGYISAIGGSRPPNYYAQVSQYSCGMNDSVLEGEGGPAGQAEFCEPRHVRVDHDGNIYFTASNTMILKINPHGILTRVAGVVRKNQWGTPNGDGGPAVDAIMNPRHIEVAMDGTLYYYEYTAETISVRVVYPDGLINTFAGGVRGPVGGTGDGGPARLATFGGIQGTTYGPDGVLYIISSNASRIRAVSPVFPEYRGVDISLPSEDGSLVYQFDEAGRHLRSLSSLTAAVIYDFGYNSEGRLVTVTDGDGNVTTIERNVAGEPNAILGPFGHQTKLVVNTNGFLETLTNPAGETLEITTNPEGLIVETTDPRGATSSYAYDEMGLLIQNSDRAGYTQTFNRISGEQILTVTRTTPLGRDVSYTIQRDFDDVVTQEITMADGTQSNHVNDVNIGGVILISPDGSQRSIETGPDPRFGVMSAVVENVTITRPSLNTISVTGARTMDLANSEDPFSLISLTDTRTINGQSFTRIFTSNDRTFVTTSAEGRTSTSTIDELGREIQRQDAGLHPTSVNYDLRGFPETITLGSGSEVRVYSLVFNTQGYMESITDPLSRTRNFSYDEVGRVTSTQLPDGRSYSYEYDKNGNMTVVTPPNRPPHTLSYTSRDRIAAITPPAVTGSGPTSYIYNADGLLTVIQRPGDSRVEYGYDAAGRLIERVYKLGESITHSDQLTYDSAGRLETHSANDVTSSYEYDGAALLSETWTGDVSGSVSRTYGDNFLVASQSVNASYTVDFSYDKDDFLTKAGTMTLSPNPTSGIPNGSTIDEITTSVVVSGFGELENYEASVSGSPIYSATYIRNVIGRIERVIEQVSGVTDTYDFEYDLAGHLIDVGKNTVAVEHYEFDSHGNRMGATVYGETVAAVYDDQDRLLNYGSTNFTYDDNGETQTETTGSDVTIYKYSEFGYLEAVTLADGTVIDYINDAFGRRIAKQVDGVRVKEFLFSDTYRIVAELDGEGQMVSRFVYADTAVPVYMERDGNTYRFVTDHRGSVRLVVNSLTGVIEQRMDYDSFGNVLTDTSPGFQPFGFIGGIYDSDTELTRLGARDYSATTGRWLSKDPAWFAGLDTNLYRYALGDPINYVDRTGLASDLSDFYTELTNAEISVNPETGQSMETFSDLQDKLREQFKKEDTAIENARKKQRQEELARKKRIENLKNKSPRSHQGRILAAVEKAQATACDVLEKAKTVKTVSKTGLRVFGFLANVFDSLKLIFDVVILEKEATVLDVCDAINPLPTCGAFIYESSPNHLPPST